MTTQTPSPSTPQPSQSSPRRGYEASIFLYDPATGEQRMVRVAADVTFAEALQAAAARPREKHMVWDSLEGEMTPFLDAVVEDMTEGVPVCFYDPFEGRWI